MRLSFLILAIISVVLAVPFNLEKAKNGMQLTDAKSSSRIFEDIILELLENVRELIKTGTDTIPVLDPLVFEELRLDGDANGLPGAYLSLKNLSMQGLSTFDIDELTISVASILLQRYRVDFNAYVPTIYVNTENYDLYVKIFGGEIFGSGDMKLRVVNPRVKGYVTVAAQLSTQGIFLSIHECRISFGLSSFEPIITGLFGNEVSSEFASSFLKTLIPELLEFFEDDITDAISSVVYTEGNALLEDVNLIDLIGSRNMDALTYSIKQSQQ